MIPYYETPRPPSPNNLSKTRTIHHDPSPPRPRPVQPQLLQRVFLLNRFAKHAASGCSALCVFARFNAFSPRLKSLTRRTTSCVKIRAPRGNGAKNRGNNEQSHVLLELLPDSTAFVDQNKTRRYRKCVSPERFRVRI